MIYHETQSDNLIETYLNLEELVCLSRATGVLCKLKTSELIKGVFNLSEFDLIEEIPASATTCDLSDYVCMYKKDTDDFFGADFLTNSKPHFFCLDKFDNQDFKVSFSNPNFYESKYYTSDVFHYVSAINSASQFHLNIDFIKKYQLYPDTIAELPLLCISSKSLATDVEFPFTHCFYTSECDEALTKKFLSDHKLNGYDIKKNIANFNSNILEYELDLILIHMAHRFTALYGSFGDKMFGILSKQFYINGRKPKVIGSLKMVYPKAKFDFSRYDLDIDRIELMSGMRFSDCVNNFIQSTDDVR